MKVGVCKKIRSPKRKSRSPKRRSPKRRSPKRRSPKRKSRSREPCKSHQRRNRSTGRCRNKVQSKRRSPKRKSPKRKSRSRKPSRKRSGFPGQNDGFPDFPPVEHGDFSPMSPQDLSCGHMNDTIIRSGRSVCLGKEDPITMEDITAENVDDSLCLQGHCYKKSTLQKLKNDGRGRFLDPMTRREVMDPYRLLDTAISDLCPPGQYWDRHTARCRERPTPCRPNEIRDLHTGRCREICPPDQVWDRHNGCIQPMDTE